MPTHFQIIMSGNVPQGALRDLRSSVWLSVPTVVRRLTEAARGTIEL